MNCTVPNQRHQYREIKKTKTGNLDTRYRNTYRRARWCTTSTMRCSRFNSSLVVVRQGMFWSKWAWWWRLRRVAWEKHRWCLVISLVPLGLWCSSWRGRSLLYSRLKDSDVSGVRLRTWRCGRTRCSLLGVWTSAYEAQSCYTARILCKTGRFGSRSSTLVLWKLLLVL